jgi:MFS family permease
MLAEASASIGRGRTFAIHEALDQSGALLGPLLVAVMVAISGYRLGFAVLAVPGTLALVALLRLRAAAPEPAAYERLHPEPAADDSPAASTIDEPFSSRFWLYAVFTALTMPALRRSRCWPTTCRSTGSSVSR